MSQTTPKLVPFHHLDLALVNAYVRFIGAGKEKQFDGPAYSAVYDGGVIGCAGVVIPIPGFGIAWAVLSAQLLKQFPVWTTKIVKRNLHDIRRAFDLKRIELSAPSPEAERWAEVLGFTPENGCARNYGAVGITVKRYELING